MCNVYCKNKLSTAGCQRFTVMAMRLELSAFCVAKSVQSDFAPFELESNIKF